MSDPSAVSPGEKTFFGHPRGLSTLFFTELWERFSYYGMRALLILFMTDAVATGGLDMGEEEAGAIYGLYTFSVYALALPGGWMADRLLGQRRAVLYGGIVIAAGHYTLAVPSESTFYLGLALVALGTGLLKPNVSSIVGDLYKDKGARRDAGFTIFYMGINVGALLGPLVCSTLGEGTGSWKGNWHLGFSAAGIGMTFALIWYVIGTRRLGDAGQLKAEFALPERIAQAWKRFFLGVGFIVALVALLVGLSASGAVSLGLIQFADSTGVIVAGLSIAYFAYVISFACRDNDERKRVAVIACLFLGAAMFWSGFEQAGSSMNLFARDYTDRGFFGWEMPAGWLQNVNPFFIIVLAPVVGGLWVKLGARNPSLGMKFAVGLFLLAVGFLVMAWGSVYTGEGDGVSPTWLVVTYFFHTVGELCLSPVGLSGVTKLSPPRLVSQMMGTWFMGAALGNLIAGRIAGYIEQLPLPELFANVAAIAGATGVVFLLLVVPIRRMAGGIK